MKVKKNLLNISIFRLLVFIILSLFMWILDLAPIYSLPSYLISQASLTEQLHSIVYYLLIFVLSLFLVYATRHHFWHRCLHRLKAIASEKYQVLRRNPAGLLVYLLQILFAFILAYVIEYIYGHFYLAEKNSLGTYFSLYRYWFFFTVVFVMISFVYFRRSLIQKPERAFLLLALTSTILLGSTLQPTTNISWDDQVHYLHSLNLSHPKEITETMADNNIIHYVYDFSFNMKTNQNMIQSLDKDFHKEPLNILPTKYGKILINPAYLPSGLFLFLGRALNLPFHISFILGRLANSLLYILLMYLAIKKLKTGKLILLTFALLPTCIFLASNYNYDSWVLGFTALGFSCLFSNLQSPGEYIKIKDIFLIILCLLIGFSPKAIYFPLMLLIFLLPKEKFRHPKHYSYFRLGTLAAVLVLIASFVLPMLVQGVTTDTRGGNDVNGGSQLSYIFSHPIAYAQTLLSFLKDYLSIENTGDFTQNWAFLYNSSHEVLSLFTLGLVVFTDRNELDAYTTKRKNRIVTVLLCFASVCLVCTAFYIAFTPIGKDTINGCQPRYLLPVLFPLLYIIGPPLKSSFFTKAFHHYVLYSILGYILFCSIWSMTTANYY